MENALLKRIIQQDLVNIKMNQQTFAKNFNNLEDKQAQLVNILNDISANIISIKNEAKAIRNLLKNTHSQPYAPQIREILVSKETDVFDDIETEIDDESTSDGNLDDVFTPVTEEQVHPSNSLSLSNMFQRNPDQLLFLLASHEQEAAKLSEDKIALQIQCDKLEHTIKQSETLKSSKSVHKNHRNSNNASTRSNSNNSNHSTARNCSNNSERRSAIGNISLLPSDTNDINSNKSNQDLYTNEAIFQMKPEDELIQLESVSMYQNKYHITNHRMSILHENQSEFNHVGAQSDDTSIYTNNRKFDINKHQLSSIPISISEESTCPLTINHIKFPPMFRINDTRHMNGNNQNDIGIKGSKSKQITYSSQTKLKKR